LQVQVLSPLPPLGRIHRHSRRNRKNQAIVLTGMRRYLVESWAELKKVAWPTRETVIRLTLLVVGVSVAVGVYIYALDRVFNTLLDVVLP
jgi:preprotein translocase SecE subunit